MWTRTCWHKQWQSVMYITNIYSIGLLFLVQCSKNIYSIGLLFLVQSSMTVELVQFVPGLQATVEQSFNACLPGYFGEGCGRKCPAVCSLSCDDQGLCTSCSLAGVQLPACVHKCSRGYFGLHCKNRCWACRYADCDAQTGECRQCQSPGLRLPFCSVPCLSGTFGENCRSRCPLSCGGTCDPVTGACTECLHGQGPLCRVNCASENNRKVCKLYCPDKCLTWCDTVNSSCTLCAPGYKAPYCKQTCDDGYYGNNCLEVCSSRCKDLSCQPVTGWCYACIDGYVGQRCNGQCVVGLYGPDCLLPCPETCADNLCDVTTGNCTRCHPGYTGARCYELCPEGKYGEDCHLDCPKTCGNKCDPLSGECWQCVPGFVGAFCNESCKNGTHGQGCVNVCPTGCAKNICDHVTGTCFSCKENLRGRLCDELDPRGQTDMKFAILLSLGSTLFAIILAFVVMCFKCNTRKVVDGETEKHSNAVSQDSFDIHVKKNRYCYFKTAQPGDKENNRPHSGLKLTIKDVPRTQTDSRSATFHVNCVQHISEHFYSKKRYMRPHDLKESCVLGESEEEIDSHAKSALPQPERRLYFPSFRFFYGNKLSKRDRQDSLIVDPKITSQAMSKLNKKSFRSIDKCLCNSEGNTARSIKESGNIFTYSTKELCSQTKFLTKAKMNLIEGIESSHTKTTKTRPVLQPLPGPSQRSPEIISTATSYATIQCKRVISETNSLSGTSIDFSHQKTPIHHTDRHDKESGQESHACHTKSHNKKNYRETPIHHKNIHKKENGQETHTSHSNIYNKENGGETSIQHASSYDKENDRETASRHTNSLNKENGSETHIHHTNSPDKENGQETHTRHSNSHNKNNGRETPIRQLSSYNKKESERVLSMYGMSNVETVTNAIKNTYSHVTANGTRCENYILNSGTSSLSAEGSTCFKSPLYVGGETHKSREGDMRNSPCVDSETHSDHFDDLPQLNKFNNQIFPNVGSRREMNIHDKKQIQKNLDLKQIGLISEKKRKSRDCITETVCTFNQLNIEKCSHLDHDGAMKENTKSQDQPASPPLISVHNGSSQSPSPFDLQNPLNCSSIMSPLNFPLISNGTFPAYFRLATGSTVVTTPAVSPEHHSPQAVRASTRPHGADILSAGGLQHSKLISEDNPTIQESEEELGKNKTFHGVSLRWTARGAALGENPSPKLIRCATTRQVSPMYSHNNFSQTGARLQPLPTPPPEGIKALRPIRKMSVSPPSSSESSMPDTERSHQNY